MIVIKNTRSSNKYTGTLVVTDDMADKLDLSFNTKLEAFYYGCDNNWSKKSIMKYLLQTEREQYFHNYLVKWIANKK